MHSIKKKQLVFIFCISLLSGCVNFGQPAPKIHFYSLDYPSPNFSELKPIDVTIHIKSFATASSLRFNQIIYKKGEYMQNAYFYHKWRSNPENMVFSFLLRDMQRAKLFKGVFSTGSIVHSPYIIEGRVDEFYEKDGEEAWKALLSVTISLIAEKKNRVVLFQKQYQEEETLKNKNPNGLANAMSSAFARISKDVISDIYVTIIEDMQLKKRVSD